MTDLITTTKEINLQVANPEVQQALLSTVFKDFTLPVMKQAITEGVIRGFEFKDFLEKNVYAIKYGTGYSLVTSVDYARKVGMKSGICGVDAPEYEVDDKGAIVSCSVTVKRKVGDYVGNYTAKVYFKEYTTGKNLWISKPRTMIAKVAEMHALRKACPEVLSQAYVEEEMSKEVPRTQDIVDEKTILEYKEKLESAKTLEELKGIWVTTPATIKKKLKGTKDECKKKLETVVEVDVVEHVQILSDEEEGKIN